MTGAAEEVATAAGAVAAADEAAVGVVAMVETGNGPAMAVTGVGAVTDAAAVVDTAAAAVAVAATWTHVVEEEAAGDVDASAMMAAKGVAAAGTRAREVAAVTRGDTAVVDVVAAVVATTADVITAEEMEGTEAGVLRTRQEEEARTEKSSTPEAIARGRVHSSYEMCVPR